MSLGSRRFQWLIAAVLGISIAVCFSFNPITAGEQGSAWFQRISRFCSYISYPQAQYGFLLGWISAMMLLPAMKWCAKRLLFNDGSDDRLYGLDHAILNFKLPPYSGMWMNMGYWEHETDFPQACEALLNQVLQAAGLIQLDRYGRGAALISNPPESPRSIKLVDVGFGCGDQTIYLTTQLYWINARTGLTHPLFNSYLGITIVGSQADFTRQRVSEHWMVTSNAYRTPDVQLFCADAADPSTWSPELQEAIVANRTSSCTWLLALDTLYHFKPSRQPLFDIAFSNLHSSIMAFDLILSDSASLIDRLLLRIVCRMAFTPFSNFVTKAEYEKMLVNAGYSREDITFRDVSEHVFPGVAAYMQRRDKELKKFGLGLGKFKAAGRVFDWWARSGVVRGVIVVAKRPGEL